MGMIKDLKTDVEKVKGYSFRRKLEFVREYYKLHIIVLLVAVLIAVSFIVDAGNQKETALMGALLNADPRTDVSATQLEKEFLDSLGLDPSQFQIEINTGLTYVPDDETQLEMNYATLEVLAAQVAGGLIDFAVGNYEAMLVLAYSDFFVDLSQVLTEKQLEQYAGYLLYVDMAVLEEFNKAADTGDYGADIHIPDPAKPELMQQPVPAFLKLEGNAKIGEMYSHSKEQVLFAVTGNCPNRQVLINFVDFLFS